MKDYLFCPVKNCDFKIGVDLNVSQAECVVAINQFKQHLRSHTQEQLVESLFKLAMWSKGEKTSLFKLVSGR